MITDDGSPLYKILLQNMYRLLTSFIKETGWTLLENNVEICKNINMNPDYKSLVVTPSVVLFNGKVVRYNEVSGKVKSRKKKRKIL